jgi:hypothetical protein
MNEFQHQIDNLRRRYQGGDASAREALFALLQTYLLLVIRRAARPENAQSAAAAGIRRLAQRTRQANDAGAAPQVSADDLCRTLCDEVLHAPAIAAGMARIVDTIRSAGRTTACFASRS